MDDILIVVDMQNDFVTGPLGTPEARAIVPAIAELVKKWPGKVIATMDTHDPQTYLESQEGRRLPVEHCYAYSTGWCIADEILKATYGKTKDKMQFLQKPTFGTTKWYHAPFLEGDTITLCGVCTDICVVSNALMLKAMYPEITIRVIADMCAGVTPEKHEAALEVMDSCQIDVINAKDLGELY